MCDSNAIYNIQGEKIGTSSNEEREIAKGLLDIEDSRQFFQFVGICSNDLTDDEKKKFGYLENPPKIINEGNVNELSDERIQALYKIYHKRLEMYKCFKNSIYGINGNRIPPAEIEISLGLIDIKEPRQFFKFIGICIDDLTDDEKQNLGDLENPPVINEADVNNLSDERIQALYDVYHKRLASYKCNTDVVYNKFGRKFGTSDHEEIEIHRNFLEKYKEKSPKEFFQKVGICLDDLTNDEKQLLDNLENPPVINQEDVDKLSKRLPELFKIYYKRFDDYLDDNQEYGGGGRTKRTKRKPRKSARKTRRNKRNKRKSLRKSRKIRRNRK